MEDSKKDASNVRKKGILVSAPAPSSSSSTPRRAGSGKKSDLSVVPTSNKKEFVVTPRRPPVAPVALSRSQLSNSSPYKTTPKQLTGTSRRLQVSSKTLSAGKNENVENCTPGRNKGLNSSMPKTPTNPTLNNSIRKNLPYSRNFPLSTPEFYNKVQIETPKHKAESGEVLREESSNLTVGVRVRPLSERELSDPAVSAAVNVKGNEVTVVSDNGTSHSFTYDHCFSSYDAENPMLASQDGVFTTMVHPLVDTLFKGYNACLFAYGQTGSGKSYSMMGTDIDTGSCVGTSAGIIPRFCFELFDRIDSLEDSKINSTSSQTTAKCRANVEISYFEIYNEKIHDLLGDSGDGKRAPLRVREHPKLGPYVVGLSLHAVDSYETLRGWLDVGNRQRATSSTCMNEKSSRSHSIFSILLTQRQEEGDGATQQDIVKSKVNLVDLAGSERLSQTSASGERLREGVSINCSLLALGKVIAFLSEKSSNKKRDFVPYRDSVLTWLLQESLGGNSKTTMLATISPASSHLDETLSTLRYACKARTIVNRVRVNEHPNDRVVRELRKEVERLRSLREDYQKKMMNPRYLKVNDEVSGKDEEIILLKQQLKEYEDILKKAERTWSERLEEANACKSEKMECLRRTGMALELHLEEKHPCLVNLAADPMFSGTLLYLLPPGKIRIGRLNADGQYQPDIALDGPLVSQQHCVIENKANELWLRPGHRGETFVNGELVVLPSALRHGDRLVVGGSHYFRVSVPNAAQDAVHVADYEDARAEINRIQEVKLQQQLDAEKQRAIEELEVARKEAEIELNAQRSNYEEKLRDLGTTMDDALANAQRTKEDMEEQIRILRDEIQSQQFVPPSRVEEKENLLDLSLYKSNFLETLEALMNETATDAENVLRSPTSAQASKPGGVSLYNMDVMVQEATLLCQELGIPYVFAQQQVVSVSTLAPMIRVRDKMKFRTALWQPTHFIAWLDRLRDFDPETDRVEELMDDEDSWEDDDDLYSPENSRISVNTNDIRKQLNDSINSLLISNLNDTALSEPQSQCAGNNSTFQFQQDEKLCYISSIEEALLGLRCLGIPSTYDTLDSMEENIEELKRSLNLPSGETDLGVGSNASGSVNSSYLNNSSILRSVRVLRDETPSKPIKSNLKRSHETETPQGNKSPKVVRFEVNRSK